LEEWKRPPLTVDTPLTTERKMRLRTTKTKLKDKDDIGTHNSYRHNLTMFMIILMIDLNM